MSSNPPDGPTIPITPEIDLSKYFEQIAAMEQRAVQFAQKLNRTISTALASNPQATNSFFQRLKEIDSFLNGLEARSTKVIGVIERAFTEAAQGAAQSVGQTFENTLNQLTERALADLRKAKTAIGSQSGGGGNGGGSRGGSPPSGIGPSSPRFPAREALADVNRVLDDFANQTPFQRVLSGLSQLEKSLRADLPVAADITEAAIAELNSILRSGATEIEKNQAALLALERTQKAIQSVQTGARVRAHLVGGERDNAIRDEGRGSTRASDLDDEYKRLGRTALLLGDAQNSVGKSASSLRGEIRATTAEVKKEQKADEDLKRAQDEVAKSKERATQAYDKNEAALKKNQITLGKTTEKVRASEEAQKRASDAANKFSLSSVHSHEALLSLLGVSRFLPGALGQVVSGLALIEGGARTMTGTVIAGVGAAVAGFVQLFQAGRQFNEELNRIRAQAEGLGLTVTEVKAIDFVLKQTGGSIENFAVGIKKISQAITGIGPEARETKDLLDAVFAGSGFKVDANTKRVDVLKALAREFDSLKKSGLDVTVAYEIFGRSSDEVAGRLKDLNEQLEEAERLMKRTGVTSEESVQNAKKFSRAIAELDLLWQKLLVDLGVPAVATFVVKFVSDTAGGASNLARLLDVSGVSGLAGLSGVSAEDILFALANVSGLPGLLGAANKIGRGPVPKDRAEVAAAEKELEEAKRAEEEITREQTALERLQTRLFERYQARKEPREALDEEQVALGQRQIDLLTKRVQDAQKKIALLDRIIEAEKNFIAKQEGSAADLAQSQSKLDILRPQLQQAEEELSRHRVEINRKRREISELQRQDSGRSDESREAALDFQEAEADIRFEQEGLDRTGQKFRQLEAKRQALIAARIGALKAEEAAETDLKAQNAIRRERLQLENKRSQDALRLRQSQAEIESARLDRTIANQRRVNEQTKELERLREQRDLQVDRSRFERGDQGLPFSDLLNREARAIIAAAEREKAQIDKAIAGIDVTIADLKRRKEAGLIDNEAALESSLKQKEADRDRLEFDKKKIDIDREANLFELENRTVSDLAEKRQFLLSAGLDQEQAIRNRRLVLIERAAEAELSVERDLIEARSDFESEVNRRRAGALIAELNDILKLKVSFDEQGRATVSKPLLTDSATLAQIDKKIAELEAGDLTERSRKQLDILLQIKRLRQEELDIIQRREIALVENAIALEQRKLDIIRAQIDLDSTLLSVAERRLQTLESIGLLSEFQADERRVEIERNRLELLNRQIVALRQQQQIEILRKVDPLARGNFPLTQEAITAIAGSEEVARLAQEIATLQGEADEAALSIRLAGSALGAIRNGLSEIAQLFAGAPEPFNKLEGALLGVQKIIDAFLLKDIEQDKPEVKIKQAADYHREWVEKSARFFYEAVVAAVKVQRDGGNGEIPALPDVPGPQPPSDAEKKAAQAARERTVKGLFRAATQIIGSTFSPTAGGRVAGIGGAAGTLVETFAKKLTIFGAAAGPVIGGVAQIAGSIMDFIGGIWKARAEKIANEMSQNFKLIQDNFNDGVITLGEAITQTQQNIEAARRQLGSGKVAKKGGRVQLSQLEQQAADQIRQFRQRQKQIQEKFLEDLQQLQRPEEVRGLYTSITEAFDRVKEYLRSFDTGAEALTHMAEAQEFLNRTFEELRDDASRELDDLIRREQEANRQFLNQRDAIIKEGRVQTGFEAAQDKLARLFELERNRIEERAKNEADQSKLRKQLEVIDHAFDRSDKVLDRLERAFSSLNNTLDRLAGGGGFFPGAFRGAREQVNNIVINQSFSGGDRSQIRRAGDEIEERLVRLGLANRVTGSYNPYRPVTP